MTSFLLELRLALRSLAKTPSFTLAVLLTLALGIGATTAMFSAVNALLLKPLPYPQPERVVALRSIIRGEGRVFSFSNLDFFDYRERSTRAFEGMALYTSKSVDLAGEGRPEPVNAGYVSSDFFEVLRAKPHLGGFFRRDHETPGQDKAVVLSYGLWQRRYGNDSAIAGRTIRINSEAYTVLGVAPSGFSFPMQDTQDLYLPIAKDTDPLRRGAHQFKAFGRLRPGITIPSANTEMKAIAEDLSRSYPNTNAKYTVDVRDLHDHLVGNQGKPMLLLMGAVSLLLLIACINVANLLLARALARRREVAIRASLGAGRAQLFSQFLAEGLAVGLTGSLLGLLLAKALVTLLPALLPGVGQVELVQVPRLDAPTLAFTFAVGLGTSIFFGLAPALQAGRGDLNQLLREGGRGSSGSGHRLRAALVVGEIALAMILLTSSGLLFRSFLQVLNTNPGFQAKHALSFSIRPSEARYASDEHLRNVVSDLQRRLAALPGIESVGYSTVQPMTKSGPSTNFDLGPTGAPDYTQPDAQVDITGPGYFETLRIPLLRGRYLGAQDDEHGARVLVINDAMARAYFQGQNPLGRKLRMGFNSDTSDANTIWEIVGVVGDIRTNGLENAPVPRMMYPFAQLPTQRLHMLLRTSVPPAALRGPIQEQLRQLDPDLAMGRLRDLSDSARELLSDRQQTLLLLVAFASLALLLAAIGIHGLVAFGVAQRAREIGIRMALGAQIEQVLRLVLSEGLRLTLTGVGLGLIGSWITARLLANQLYGVGAFDPFTALGVILLLLSVALMACFFPARRAARVDPAEALRSE